MLAHWYEPPRSETVVYEFAGPVKTEKKEYPFKRGGLFTSIQHAVINTWVLAEDTFPLYIYRNFESGRPMEFYTDQVRHRPSLVQGTILPFGGDITAYGKDSFSVAVVASDAIRQEVAPRNFRMGFDAILVRKSPELTKLRTNYIWSEFLRGITTELSSNMDDYASLHNAELTRLRTLRLIEDTFEREAKEELSLAKLEHDAVEGSYHEYEFGKYRAYPSQELWAIITQLVGPRSLDYLKPCRHAYIKGGMSSGKWVASCSPSNSRLNFEDGVFSIGFRENEETELVTNQKGVWTPVSPAIPPSFPTFVSNTETPSFREIQSVRLTTHRVIVAVNFLLQSPNPVIFKYGTPGGFIDILVLPSGAEIESQPLPNEVQIPYSEYRFEGEMLARNALPVRYSEAYSTVHNRMNLY